MVIGEDWSFGHLPRTGGDAVHQWCIALGLRSLGVYVDEPTTSDSAVRHDNFLPRASGKKFYCVGFRSLRETVMSILYARDHYLGSHFGYGGHITLEKALCRPWCDEWLNSMCYGINKIYILRNESLLEDLKWFLCDVVGVLNSDDSVWDMVVNVQTKPIVERDVDEFWQGKEEDIRCLNPNWFEMEKFVYEGGEKPSQFNNVFIAG